MDSEQEKRADTTAKAGWIAFVAAALLWLAPTSQSLWIDEGSMGLLSRESTVSGLRTALGQIAGSEALMPLTALYFWTVEKFVGDGEWALRCGNLPWLWLGIICLALIGRRIGWPWLPLLFAVHPVVWFYADEIRPYAIQLGAGCWLALGFVQVVQSEGKSVTGLWNLGLAAAVVSTASFLGVFVVAAAGVVLILKAVVAHWVPTRRQLGVIGFLGAVNLAFLIIMLSRLMGGAGGSKSWTVGISNLGFALYELLGLSGLGPGREALRATAVTGGLSGTVHLLLPYFGVQSALLLLYGALFCTAIYLTRKGRDSSVFQLAILSGWVAVLSVVGLFIASLVMKFPFWGRHLAPMLPFLLVAVGAAASLLSTAGSSRRSGLLLFPLFALLLFSSLEIRFNPQQGKDDYRSATALALAEVAQGKRVCWIASRQPGQFYHLTFSTTWPPAPGTASIAIPVPGVDPAPDLLFVSKLDLFDRGGRGRALIRSYPMPPKEVGLSFLVYGYPAPSGASPQ